MSRAKGNLAEDKACEFLFDNGFNIIERNFYSRFGEIDIIALKGGVYHFIEVKSGKDYESAILNITSKKLMKIIKTSDVYLKKYKINVEYVYDGLIVTPTCIDLVENITLF